MTAKKQTTSQNDAFGDKDYNVYFRNEDKSLGHVFAENTKDHKDAILKVKESLVADGCVIDNMAVLAVIK